MIRNATAAEEEEAEDALKSEAYLWPIFLSPTVARTHTYTNGRRQSPLIVFAAFLLTDPYSTTSLGPIDGGSDSGGGGGSAGYRGGGGGSAGDRGGGGGGGGGSSGS